MEVFSGKFSLVSQKNTRDGAGFLFLLVVVFVSPWLALVLMGILARGTLNEKIGKPALAIVLVCFLALFNATKRIDGDWTRYVDGYMEMSQMGLLDYLQRGGFSIRITEPLYYAFAFVLSRLSGGNLLVLVLSVSLVVYLTYIFALEKLMKEYCLHRWAAAICIIFAMLLGVTFTQSLHLVRQYIAGSLLFCLFVLILERRNKTAVIILVLGTLSHNSFIIPSTLLLVCSYLWKFPFVKRRFLSVVFILVCSGYLIGSQIATQVLDSAQAVSALLDNGEISSVVLLQDAILFFIAIAGVIFHGNSSSFYTKASAISVLFFALFGGMVLAIRDFPLFFLRFYFYFEWFRVIGIITIVWHLTYRIRAIGLATLIIPLSFLGLSLRISHSPWNYGGGLFEHLANTVTWWANQIH